MSSNASLARPKAAATIVLSGKDWDAFYAAILDPPQPNEKLTEAAGRYRALLGDDRLSSCR